MNTNLQRYLNDVKFHNLVQMIVKFVIEDKMTILDFQEAIWFIQEKDMIRQTRIDKENEYEQS
jgi:hypothetical protein